MIVETEPLNDVQRAAVEQTDGPVLNLRRSRKRKDARPHPPHRVSARREDSLPGSHPRRHVHEQGRRRDEERGSNAWSARRARLVGRHVPRDVRAHVAPRRTKIGIAPQFRDHGRHRSAPDHQGHSRTISITTSGRSRRARRSREISKAKNALISPEQYREKQTSFIGERFGNVYTRVRAPPARVATARLRRSDLAHDRSARTRRGAARKLPGASFGTSSSTSIRTSTIAQYRLVRAAGRRAQEHHGRRRRRSVDLLVARQRLPHDPALRGRLPGREGLQARGELSQHADDSRPPPTSSSRTTRPAPPRSSSRSARPANRSPSIRRRPNAPKPAT